MTESEIKTGDLLVIKLIEKCSKLKWKEELMNTRECRIGGTDIVINGDRGMDVYDLEGKPLLNYKPTSKESKTNLEILWRSASYFEGIDSEGTFASLNEALDSL